MTMFRCLVLNLLAFSSKTSAHRPTERAAAQGAIDIHQNGHLSRGKASLASLVKGHTSDGPCTEACECTGDGGRGNPNPQPQIHTKCPECYNQFSLKTKKGGLQTDWKQGKKTPKWQKHYMTDDCSGADLKAAFDKHQEEEEEKAKGDAITSDSTKGSTTEEGSTSEGGNGSDQAGQQGESEEEKKEKEAKAAEEEAKKGAAAAAKAADEAKKKIIASEESVSQDVLSKFDEHWDENHLKVYKELTDQLNEKKKTVGKTEH